MYCNILVNKPFDHYFTYKFNKHQRVKKGSIVTISFGMRNFNNYEEALKEINRVLKPNGTLAILEFCKPKNNLFQMLFSFYFNKIIPIIGKILTGEKLFDYLPESVNNFFSINELSQKIENFPGFHNSSG